MKVEVRRLLENSNEYIESATLNLKEFFFDSSVNRSYYAVFEVVSALLLLKEVTVKFHSGAIQR